MKVQKRVIERIMMRCMERQRQDRNVSLSEITEATGWNERSGDFDEKMRRNEEKEEA